MNLIDWFWFRLSGWLWSHRLGGLVVVVEMARALPGMPSREWPAFLRGDMEGGDER